MVIAQPREGYVEVPGGKVWYRVSGDGAGVPLLLLHGGPGSGHDSFDRMVALGDERPVVFYDQLGCGKSEIPDEPLFWQMDRFVAEVDAVREGLGLDRIHLLGQSWGGWLAIEYMMTHPQGVASLTLSSTSASVEGFIRGAKALVAELPAETRETIERHEAAGTTADPEYQAAARVFYQRHLCRMDPWPEEMARSGNNIRNTPVYNYMWGPSEFTCTGNLNGWDRSDRLGEITVPTLITHGRYDEMVPALAAELHAGIPNSDVVMFDQSAHAAHLEESDLYIATLREFLKRVETA
jgi:proline-specific peptidase